MQNNNQITKEDAQKWVNALRSGDYKQTAGALNLADGYCCLGVACDVFIPKIDQERRGDGTLLGGFPGSQSKSPIWLRDINADMNDKVGRRLSELNDLGLYSFDDIANLIELVYVHGALDEEEIG